MSHQEEILIQTLIRLELISRADLTEALAYQSRLPQSQLKPISAILVDLELLTPSILNALQQLPVETLQKIPAASDMQALLRECNQSTTDNIIPFRAVTPAQAHLSQADRRFLQQVMVCGQLQSWEIEGVLELQSKQPPMLRQSLAELFVAEGYLSVEQIHAMWAVGVMAA